MSEVVVDCVEVGTEIPWRPGWISRVKATTMCLRALGALRETLESWPAG